MPNSAKSAVYLGLIFAVFLVAHIIPLGQMFGAPASIVMLAFFEPFFKTKKTLLILFLIAGLNIVENIGFYSAYVMSSASIMSVYGSPTIFATLFAIYSVVMAFILELRTAEKIIKLSKIRVKYPFPL